MIEPHVNDDWRMCSCAACNRECEKFHARRVRKESIALLEQLLGRVVFRGRRR